MKKLTRNRKLALLLAVVMVLSAFGMYFQTAFATDDSTPYYLAGEGGTSPPAMDITTSSPPAIDVSTPPAIEIDLPRDQGDTFMAAEFAVELFNAGTPIVTRMWGDPITPNPILTRNLTFEQNTQNQTFEVVYHVQLPAGHPTVPAGQMEIHIPRHIINDRNGAPMGDAAFTAGFPTSPNSPDAIRLGFYLSNPNATSGNFIVRNATPTTQHTAMNFSVRYTANMTTLAATFTGVSTTRSFIGGTMVGQSNLTLTINKNTNPPAASIGIIKQQSDGISTFASWQGTWGPEVTLPGGITNLDILYVSFDISVSTNTTGLLLDRINFTGAPGNNGVIVAWGRQETIGGAFVFHQTPFNTSGAFIRGTANDPNPVRRIIVRFERSQLASIPNGLRGTSSASAEMILEGGTTVTRGDANVPFYYTSLTIVGLDLTKAVTAPTASNMSLTWNTAAWGPAPPSVSSGVPSFFVAYTLTPHNTENAIIERISFTDTPGNGGSIVSWGRRTAPAAAIAWLDNAATPFNGTASDYVRGGGFTQTRYVIVRYPISNLTSPANRIGVVGTNNATAAFTLNTGNIINRAASAAFEWETPLPAVTKQAAWNGANQTVISGTWQSQWGTRPALPANVASDDVVYVQWRIDVTDPSTLPGWNISSINFTDTPGNRGTVVSWGRQTTVGGAPEFVQTDFNSAASNYPAGGSISRTRWVVVRYLKHDLGFLNGYYSGSNLIEAEITLGNGFTVHRAYRGYFHNVPEGGVGGGGSGGGRRPGAAQPIPEPWFRLALHARVEERPGSGEFQTPRIHDSWHNPAGVTSARLWRWPLLYNLEHQQTIEFSMMHFDMNSFALTNQPNQDPYYVTLINDVFFLDNERLGYGDYEVTRVNFNHPRVQLMHPTGGPQYLGSNSNQGRNYWFWMYREQRFAGSFAGGRVYSQSMMASPFQTIYARRSDNDPWIPIVEYRHRRTLFWGFTPVRTVEWFDMRVLYPTAGTLQSLRVTGPTQPGAPDGIDLPPGMTQVKVTFSSYELFESQTQGWSVTGELVPGNAANANELLRTSVEMELRPSARVIGLIERNPRAVLTAVNTMLVHDHEGVLANPGSADEILGTMRDYIIDRDIRLHGHVAMHAYWTERFMYDTITRVYQNNPAPIGGVVADTNTQRMNFSLRFIAGNRMLEDRLMAPVAFRNLATEQLAGTFHALLPPGALLNPDELIAAWALDGDFSVTWRYGQDIIVDTLSQQAIVDSVEQFPN